MRVLPPPRTPFKTGACSERVGTPIARRDHLHLGPCACAEGLSRAHANGSFGRLARSLGPPDGPSSSRAGVRLSREPAPWPQSRVARAASRRVAVRADVERHPPGGQCSEVPPSRGRPSRPRLLRERLGRRRARRRDTRLLGTLAIQPSIAPAISAHFSAAIIRCGRPQTRGSPSAPGTSRTS